MTERQHNASEQVVAPKKESWHVLAVVRGRPEQDTPVAVCKTKEQAERLVERYRKNTQGLTYWIHRVVLGALALTFTLVTPAEAQVGCRYVPPGAVQLTRTGFLFARGVGGRVSCSVNAPTVVYWPGGNMCRGRSIFGRDAFRRPFSCRVLSVYWR